MQSISFAFGISSLGIVLMGIFLFIYYTLRAYRVKNSLIFLMGLSIVLTSAAWLDNAISFVMLLTSGTQLSIETAVFITTPVFSVGLILWNLTVYLLLKQRTSLIGLLIVCIHVVVLLYLITFSFSEYISSSQIGDFIIPEYATICAVMILLIVVVSMLNVSFRFLSFTRDIKNNPEEYGKCMGLGVGTFLYGLFAIIDGALELSVVMVILIRVLVIFALVIISVAVLHPMVIAKVLRYNESQ